MADGLNRVCLLGNVGADPELRVTPQGQSVLKIRMATSESYLDKNRVRQEKTEWHSLVVWGKRAEALAKLVEKGSRIYAEGSLQTRSYEDKDKNKRYSTEINCNELILCGGPGSQRRQDPAPEREPGEDDDVPY